MADETLVAEALIGDEAEAFMNSELGRVVLGIAEQEAKVALEDLKSASVNDQERIRALQNTIWRCESFKQWLSELIDQGQQALEALRHDEDANE